MNHFTPQITHPLLTTALEAAKIGSTIAQDYTPSYTNHEEKASPSDIVTQADIEAQEAIINHIQNEHTTHSFLAEETTDEETRETEKTSTETPTWIIDPIDGTTNFQRNINKSCTMIALEKNNELHTAVIHMHDDTVFYAVKNKGAYKNEDPITTSPITQLKHSLFAYEPTNRSVTRNDIPQFNLLPFLLTETLGARKNKCAGYNFTRIAQGKYDAWIEHNAHVWDMAPGILILTEAGGKVTTLDNETEWNTLKQHPRTFVATNSNNHEEVLTIANKYHKIY